ncbi:MAG: hypothetical protein KatS3mg024_1225 [Armatimonadota bacterium]|nr:MAG: hypothetical protein KatS3mg024_1225 [Armatimonadota bacterium]
MSDYLMRDAAPLTEAEWESIDSTVLAVAKQQLVGRRVLHIFGPLGAGIQSVPTERLAAPSPGSISFEGSEDAAIEVAGRDQTPLLMVHKDFCLNWRALETSRQMGLPLDTGAAAAAAAVTARAEDRLIFLGDQEAGVEGLLTAKGRRTLALSDWSECGSAFDNLVNAVAVLSGAGYTPPYAAVLSPDLFACLLRVYKDSDTLELTHAKEALTGGVYECPVLGQKQGVVLALGRQYFDLAVGQDLATAYLESRNLNHYLRVMETIALRIKDPGAICALTKGGK